MRNNESGLNKLLNKPNVQNSGYFHTASEILKQPKMWQETMDCVLGSARELHEFLGNNPRLIFSGAGSSHFVGISIVPALRRVFAYAEAISSTEIVMDPETAFPREDFILVSFARSGNSPEGNAAVSLAEKLRPGMVMHLAITCNADGDLAKIVKGLGPKGFVLDLPAETNDVGLAMTSSFTSMTLAGLLLQYVYTEEFEKCKRYVSSLIEVGNKVISGFDSFASEISREAYTRVFFISSRPFFGGAYEAHLKVQELSGGTLVAYASDTLGLRHGFMASINEESLIVLTSSSNANRKQYEYDLLK
ncbi:MAG TPA: sugar isomerase, partial [Rikenellaceae bacterium]|nr:sugar isomerase [Rikenellaceae bacterium]